MVVCQEELTVREKERKMVGFNMGLRLHSAGTGTASR